MRLGTITGGVKAVCSLCGMEMTMRTREETSRTLLAHLERMHFRSPLLMDKQEFRARGARSGDLPQRTEYHGPRWKNDLAAGG